jgi:hypothetical protein
MKYEHMRCILSMRTCAGAAVALKPRTDVQHEARTSVCLCICAGAAVAFKRLADIQHERTSAYVFAHR